MAFGQPRSVETRKELPSPRRLGLRCRRPSSGQLPGDGQSQAGAAKLFRGRHLLEASQSLLTSVESMPMPVSLTAKMATSSSLSSIRSAQTRRLMRPWSVNLTELVSRLTRICRQRSPSAMISCGTSWSMTRLRSTAFDRALTDQLPGLFDHLPDIEGALHMHMAGFVLEKSSTSLTSSSRFSEQMRAVSR